ncbi:hypothetical protein Busp01_39980 [Trinickia caryophylli]|nr:hypothetical protein Busp01_39980 [Trinickia caryophylli]
MIESLQRQLAEIRQEVARASEQAGKSTDELHTSQVEALTARESAISSALQTATAELASVMLKSGKTTGIVSVQS